MLRLNRHTCAFRVTLLDLALTRSALTVSPITPTDRCGPAGAKPPRVDRRHALGRHGEQLAEAHLARLGFSTLARNVRSRAGEIDLIAFDGETLVFAEVKTLQASALYWRGSPAAAMAAPPPALATAPAGGRVAER